METRNKATRAAWTDEQLDILRRFYPHHKTEDVAFMLGRSCSSVHQKALKLDIRKTPEFLSTLLDAVVGTSTRFKKGQAAWNKGMKGLQIGGEQTRFKPGQMPRNTQPIGALRLDKSGTLQQKISNDKGSNSVRWRGVHELVWVKANGPVPPKHIIAFKPGMRTNVFEDITLDRVECISLAENMRRNTRHNMPPELNQVVQLRAVLSRHINKRMKHRDEKDC